MTEFSRAVSATGYEWGDASRDHRVRTGLETSVGDKDAVRHYRPMVDQPTLFRKFARLETAEEYIAFANEFGQLTNGVTVIDEDGYVLEECGPRTPTAGPGTASLAGAVMISAAGPTPDALRQAGRADPLPGRPPGGRVSRSGAATSGLSHHAASSHIQTTRPLPRQSLAAKIPGGTSRLSASHFTGMWAAPSFARSCSYTGLNFSQLPIGSRMAHAAPGKRLWAKLGSNTYPDNYHSLLAHLTDVGCVARELLERHAPSVVRDRVAGTLGLPAADAAAWVAFWAAAHDVGKAIPGFQYRDNSRALRAELEPHGFAAGGGQPPPHAFASAAILKKWLEGRGCNTPLANRIAHAIGGHHGLFPGTLPASRHDLGGYPWEAVQVELLDFLAGQFGVPAVPPTAGAGTDQSAFLYLAGLVTVADWVASNEEFFPWVKDPPTDYIATSAERAEEALRRIRWPRSGSPALPEPFAAVFPRWPPRPLQTACEAVVRTLAGPALLLVEAPMGEGKTEAALYAADWWRRRTGGGAYVALPTMATSNGLFPRVRDFLAATVSRWAELHLLHGQAILSDTYQEVRTLGEVHDDADAAGVAAHAWFAMDKKQAILAPYGVGTIDQALLAVVQTKHFFLRLFGLAGKTVVLDEVHAYDVYMSTLMELLLKWLAALGCPVVLLSATLPAERRRALLRAYTGKDQAVLPTEPYPRITWATQDGSIDCKPVEATPGRDREIVLDRIAETDLAEQLKVALADGGCACVIRNTVGLSQETYRTLKAAFAGTGIRVLLFHARFLFGRRQHIEAEVLEFFGKDGPRPEKAVLVATQVVEQSLDLDFDLMATDVAPVDLVLQRSGRLHRHGGRTRPAAVAEPRLLLIHPGLKDDRSDFGKSEFVYGRYVLLRSWEVLRGKPTLSVPQEIEPLVEATYADRHEADPDFAAAKQLDAEERERLQQKATGILAPAPSMKRNFWTCWNAGLGEDEDPTTHPARRAATRDVEPTVHLVVAYVKDDREYLDSSCHERMAVDQVLTAGNLEHARAILANAVSVSNPGCFRHYARQNPPKGWAKNGLLKHHRLVRVGPDGMSLTPDEYPLTVDEEIGVRFTREPTET